MAKMNLDEALDVVHLYTQYDHRVPEGARFATVQKIEHAIGFPIMRRQRRFNLGTSEALEGLREQLRMSSGTGAQRAEYASHHEGLAALRRDFVALQQENVALTRKIEELSTQQRVGQANVELFLNRVRKSLPDAPTREELASLPNAWDGLYAAFEDLYRGGFEEIQERLRPYLADLPYGEGRLLDVGCGRGEWLSLLKDNDIDAYGIDLNAEVSARATELGTEVVIGDALTHLEEIAPKSLSAVTAFHLAEHLDVETLIALLDRSLGALRPGGRIILETPNPANLTVGATTFHLDPTHVLPLPPQLLEFLVRSRGFVEVEVRPLHRGLVPFEVPEGAMAPVVELLNTLLKTAPDYAVIGTRL